MSTTTDPGRNALMMSSAKTFGAAATRRACSLIVPVTETNSSVAGRFHDNLVTEMDELLNARRHEAQSIFVGFDFFNCSDLNGRAPWLSHFIQRQIPILSAIIIYRAQTPQGRSPRDRKRRPSLPGRGKYASRVPRRRLVFETPSPIGGFCQ